MIEHLETRIAPAVFILPTSTTASGVLNLVHDSAAAGSADDATLAQTAPGTFELRDGATVLDTFTGVKTINYTGGDGDDRFTLQLLGDNLAGNVSFKGGEGGDVFTLTAQDSGRVLGSLTVDGGSGTNSHTISASVVKTLTILGGAGADTANVASPFIGKLAVKNIETFILAGGGVNVVGAASVDNRASGSGTTVVFSGYTFTGAVSVLGGTTDDFVTFTPVATFEKTATINFGRDNGDNSFSDDAVHRGTLSYSGSAGADIVNLSGSYLGVKLAAGEGTNLIRVFSTPTRTATVLGTFEVSAGAGNDTVTAQGYNTVDNERFLPVLQTVKLTLGNGDNTVDFSDGARVQGNLTITTGLGLDDFDFALGGVLGAVKIAAGAGANSLSMQGLDAINLFYAGSLSYTGGSGTDSVTLNRINLGGAVNLALGDGGNTVTSSSSAFFTGKAVTIKGGSGVDGISLGGFALPQAKLSIYTYAGADTLTLAGAALSAYLDAGSGTDAVSIGGLRYGSLVVRDAA